MIAPLCFPPPATNPAALPALLYAAVEGSASVGYVVPFPESAVAACWTGALAEVAARTLPILATSATGNAVNLYNRSGYLRAGGLPGYTADPDGTLISYKPLAP